MPPSMTDAHENGDRALRMSTKPELDSLLVLHQRLEAHFSALRARRDQHGNRAPIFALEHGLSDAELALLDAAVRAAVAARRLPRQSWLPLVVYASEVGYRYAGDEYWQTFESLTPGWAVSGDRPYVREVFEDFAGRFGGAVPTGAWASWFSIISWPITHSVLPTYLQVQLAELLFDYRYALSSELLADPDALGRNLAAQALRYSSRFKTFAQNTSLLGQVATALLAGDDEESPYLLGPTLRRIVDSLSAERQARRWLQDAKSSASKVRARGFMPAARGHPGRSHPERLRLPTSTDPDVYLREGTGGWAAWLSLPDLSVLAERLPGIHEELDRLRVKVAGSAGSPLASGRLLFAGQRLRLARWPGHQEPLLQLEGGSAESNNVLADQCVLSPGPPWVFRLREPRLATEVRGKFVRPGRSYVLILREPAEPCDLPGWITPADCSTIGPNAYAVQVPEPADSGHLQILRSLGIAVQADITIRPAGLVPATWDGEGAAAWIAGEDAVLAVKSARTVAQCIFEIDQVPRLLTWPDGQDEIFVTVAGAGVGAHEARVTLLAPDVDEPLAQGVIVLSVRAPHARPPVGSVREGVMLLPSPASPSLPEIWDGRAAIQILGPAGIPVRVQISLLDRASDELAQRDFRATIPVTPQGWHQIAQRELRRSEQLQRAYDIAESCTITVSDPLLGTARLWCEREFAPLRWTAGKIHQVPFARLIDNTDSGTTLIERFEFSSPAEPSPVTADAEGYLRWAPGGLLRASSGGFEASVILPPMVRSLADLQSARVVPHIATGTQTADELRRMIGLARLWAVADLPADPVADHARRAVLRAVASHLTCLVAGRIWTRMEQAIADRPPPLSDIQDGVGRERYQQALATDVASNLTRWLIVAPEERAPEFGALITRHVPRVELGGDPAWFAELILRMASEPASVAGWPEEEVTRALKELIVAPVLIRAARFVVLAIHSSTDQEATNSTYGGWQWT